MKSFASPRASLLPCLLTAAFVLGCSSDNSANDAGPAAGSSSGGSDGASDGNNGAAAGSTDSAGAAAAVQGSVVVSLAPPTDGADGYATVVARFFDGPTPDPFPLKLAAKQAGCQLFVPLLPFCTEACSPGVCTADDQCTSYPAPLSVGALTLSGLGSDLMLAPATSMIVYQSPSLPSPPCTEGAQVAVSSGAFSLQATCVAQLTLSGPDPIPVKSGAGVQVSWEPAKTADNSLVRISLDLSHHGGKKGQINCEVADTGTYEIPEPLVTQLVGLGLAGYPTINVNRVSVGVDPKTSEVSLVLSSAITRAVDTGVVSCQDDAECHDGQTCQDGGTCG